MAALGPPLKFLPKDLEPSELEAYRHDYQAFRAGHHLGAHGEIEGLQLRAQHAASQGSLNGSDGAYFSEPERGSTPPGLARLEGHKANKIGQRDQGHVSAGFSAWMSDEIASRPDESQLPRVPRSHLLEVARVPLRLEKILAFGFLLCLDMLLHELSFTPLQVLFALPRAVAHAFGKMGKWGPSISVTEKCESFLKLYVFFNMLELFERWLRSVGVDLFDLLAASCRQGLMELLPKYLLAPRMWTTLDEMLRYAEMRS
eukprot:Skav209908  [mRNA]  locus=scaffold1253:67514:68807:- [translate_table: standard]